jgi:septin family protein
LKDIDNNKDNDIEVIINYLEKRIAEILEQEKKMLYPN